MDFGSFKDLENVRLKATYNIELGNRLIVPGETIAFFDKIQIAGIKEINDYVAARGGYENRERVYWETTREVNLSFSQGVFSKQQFALMANARMIENEDSQVILLSYRENLESNEEGKFICKYLPKDLFVYDAQTGERLEHTQNENEITISSAYTNVIVDYTFDYVQPNQIVRIGQRLTQGYLSLEGITRVKDDITGQIITGVIKIPKLRLMSNLSMRLGTNANPVVANFSAAGVPVGSRGNTYVMEFYYLSDDINSDL